VKTALVLSAGGMFGAWQAGAWRSLARRSSPGMVIGASAGALNAWAIAGGLSPDELAEAWLDGETANLLRPRFGFPLFDPKPLRRTAQMLFERCRPQIPFACTLVEARSLKLRLVRGEEMTWRHLEAACAIPFGLPPVRLDGRWCVDGGLLGALPLWAAAELGAASAIALDSLPQMPSRLVRSAAGLARRLGSPRTAPAGFPVTLLRPLRRLGGLRDAVLWNRENARRWLEQGEQDADLLEL
jgi:NTE family protein